MSYYNYYTVSTPYSYNPASSISAGVPLWHVHPETSKWYAWKSIGGTSCTFSTSTNLGGSWNDIVVPFGYLGYGWDVSTADENVIYTGTMNAPAAGFSGAVSTNGGSSWSTFTILIGGEVVAVQYVWISPTNAAKAYARVSVPSNDDRYLYLTTDYGVTWNPITTVGVVPNAAISSNVNQSLVIDPNNDQIVYFGAGGYVNTFYRTTNGGSSWSTLSMPVGSVYPWVLFIDSVTGILYCLGPGLSTSLWNWAVFQSSDGGDNWTQTFNELGGGYSKGYFNMSSPVANVMRWDGAHPTIVFEVTWPYFNYRFIITYDLDINNGTFSTSNSGTSAEYAVEIVNPYVVTYTTRAYLHRVDLCLAIHGVVYDAIGGQPLQGVNLGSTSGSCAGGYSNVNGLYELYVPYNSSGCAYASPASGQTSNTGTLFPDGFSFTNITSDITHDFYGTPAFIPSGGNVCYSYEEELGLSSYPSGGTWSGSGITNSSTGFFDASVAGPGTWTVTWSITQPTTCPAISGVLTLNSWYTVGSATTLTMNISTAKTYFSNSTFNNAVFSSGFTAPVTYTWYEAAYSLTPSYSVILSGVDETQMSASHASGHYLYYCSATDSLGCSMQTSPVDIYWSSFTLDGSLVGVLSTTLSAVPTTSGAVFAEYRWLSYQFPELINSPTIESIGDSFTPTSTGYYAVQVTDDNGSITLSDIVEVDILSLLCYKVDCSTSDSLVADIVSVNDSLKLSPGVASVEVTVSTNLPLDEPPTAYTNTAPCNSVFTATFNVLSGTIDPNNLLYTWYGPFVSTNTGLVMLGPSPLNRPPSSQCVSIAFACSGTSNIYVVVTDTSTGATYTSNTVTVNTYGFDCPYYPPIV